MAQTKTERLLQLVLCLSQGRRAITRAQLQQAIPDYAHCASDEAFERMFERDKNELRELGIPLETSGDPGDDDAGYRIDRSDYALPELHLTRPEMTAMALAARVWRAPGPASAAARALLKLSAQGIDVDAAELPAIEPRLSGGEAAFGPLTAAVSARQSVEFGYRTSRDAEQMIRHLQPWGVVSSRGRWYVVGHDLDREATRVFRLSRIEGDITVRGAAGAFEVPLGVDLRGSVYRFDAEPTDGEAVVLVRPGLGVGLRRRATDAAVAVTVDGEQWERIRVAHAGTRQLGEEIASYGPAVLVESPLELRSAVIERLQADLRAHEAL